MTAIQTIEAAFTKYGLNIQHTADVTTALANRKTVHEYLNTAEEDPSALLAAGQVKQAVAAQQAKNIRDQFAQQSNARALADQAVDRGVNAEIEHYLSQLLPTIAAAVTELREIGQSLPIDRRDCFNNEAAVRGRWGSELGAALDSAADIREYSKVVTTLLGGKRADPHTSTAVLVDIPRGRQTIIPESAQANIDQLADLSRGLDAKDLVTIALDGWPALTLEPSADLDVIATRARAWASQFK